MIYFAVPGVLLAAGYVLAVWRLGLGPASKWLGVAAVAEVVSFLPLMGIPGAIAMLLATPWVRLVFGRWLGDAVTGDAAWPSAIGVSFTVPVGFFVAAIVVAESCADKSAAIRWSVFAAVMALWASICPFFYALQDPAFLKLLRG